jgi:hypothetical protein
MPAQTDEVELSVEPVKVFTVTASDALPVIDHACPAPEFSYMPVLTLSEAIRNLISGRPIRRSAYEAYTARRLPLPAGFVQPYNA